MNTNITEQIIERENQRADALLAADMEALAALLSDRLVFAHANATFDDKASLLTKMGSGNIVYKALNISDKRVIDLGDTALLISHLVADVSVGGQPRSIDNWTLSVWVREQDEWRLLAYQPTAVPKAS